MKKIIIAGANGFLGSSFVKRLMKEDVHIWTLVRNPECAFPESDRITKVKLTSGLKEMKTVLKPQKYDLFYNFAWQGVNGPDKANYEIQIDNIKRTLQFAELAHLLGCRKYLCTGTVAERSSQSLDHLERTSGGMLYGVSKACCRMLLETYCKNVGISYVWMQLSNIYGPGNQSGNILDYTIQQLTRGAPASFGPAQQPYDFLYIDDLMEAIYRFGIENTHGSYYIGSGQPRILEQYLRSVGEIYGRPDLIRIGERPDDGIRYSFEMLDNRKTIAAVGDYISDSFENHIQDTLNHYLKR